MCLLSLFSLLPFPTIRLSSFLTLLNHFLLLLCLSFFFLRPLPSFSYVRLFAIYSLCPVSSFSSNSSDFSLCHFLLVKLFLFYVFLSSYFLANVSSCCCCCFPDLFHRFRRLPPLPPPPPLPPMFRLPSLQCWSSSHYLIDFSFLPFLYQ